MSAQMKYHKKVQILIVVSKKCKSLWFFYMFICDDRRTDRQTDRQTDWQTHTHTGVFWNLLLSKILQLKYSLFTFTIILPWYFKWSIFFFNILWLTIFFSYIFSKTDFFFNIPLFSQYSIWLTTNLLILVHHF